MMFSAVQGLLDQLLALEFIQVSLQSHGLLSQQPPHLPAGEYLRVRGGPGPGDAGGPERGQQLGPLPHNVAPLPGALQPGHRPERLQLLPQPPQHHRRGGRQVQTYQVGIGLVTSLLMLVRWMTF